MKQYDLFNALYRANFSGPLPARVMVQVSQLGLGARFEVAGIAVRDRARAGANR
jgi:enamine deaminase RidA (YjgF/YER057c/UK114 family)